MQMNLARRLSEAIGSWLHLEFCCYRGQLFSENSLKVAVGGVLSTFPAAAKGALVHADFAHDKLNSGGAKGRPRECDFALIAHHSPDAPKCDAEVVVETKWAGSTHCTPKQVCNDLLRLAVIKHAEPGTFCVFVLAGFHSDLAKCLKGAPFTLPGKKKKGIGATGRKKRLVLPDLNLAQREPFRVPMRALSRAGIAIPRSFVCQSHGLHPVQSHQGTVRFQAIAWEIVEASTDTMHAGTWS